MPKRKWRECDCNSCAECIHCGRDRKYHTVWECSECGQEITDPEYIYETDYDFVCSDCIIEYLLGNGTITEVEDDD